MPFALSVDEPNTPADPYLRIVGERTFRLESSFVYLPKHGDPVLIPPDKDGETTDLASVPELLWGLIAPYGHQTLPAIMHDYLCEDAERKPAPTNYDYRRRADDLFREALRDVGVDPFRAATFWAGVVFGRYWQYRRPTAIWLVTVTFICTICLYAAIAILCINWQHGWPLSLGLLGTGAVVARLWRADRVWRVIYIGAYIGLPVVVALAWGYVLQLITRLLPWAVMAVLSRSHLIPSPGPRPPWGPTVVRQKR